MKTSSSAWFIYSLFSDLTPTFDREPHFKLLDFNFRPLFYVDSGIWSLPKPLNSLLIRLLRL